MADDDQSLPTEFDSRFRSVYNPPSPIPGQDTPLYSRVNIPKNDTLLERFGGLPTEGPPEAFYTPPVEGKGGTLVEAPSRPKKIKEKGYELTPVDMNVTPQSVKEVLFGYDKPVGRYQTWPERLARIVGKGAFDIVGGIPAGVTAPRDAFTGKLQVTNPETGMPTEEAVQRSIEALSVPFKAGAIGGAPAGGVTLGIVPVRTAKGLNVTRGQHPDILKQAVENTPEAKIDADGDLVVNVNRTQHPLQEGEESVRGGVFYLPEGKASKYSRFYNGTTTNVYGGSQGIKGETAYLNPLVVKGATGGKAPEMAFDQLNGKNAYKKMAEDAIQVAVGPKHMQEELAEIFLEQYAPDMIGKGYYILQNSTKGNQLIYALQEAAVSNAARKAGHDGVIGYSVGRDGKPYLSEIYDVRESHYPDTEGGYNIHPQFLSDSSKPAQAVTAISDLYKNKYFPNGVEKPEAFDRVLPAVRNLETGKISTTKRGNEHADILTRLWEREGGNPNADPMSIYEDMLPRHEMGYYDPLKKKFHLRDSEEWKNIDSPDLNPKQAMRSGMVFSDTQKPAQLLSSLTAAQRKAYNREAFHNGGQLLVPDASAEAINKLVAEPAYKKWDKAATDAGFTTDAYHGTKDFEGNTIEPKRAGKQEFYSTNEPKLAEDYAGLGSGTYSQILPLKLNTSNYNVIDAKGKTWDQVNEEAIKAAKAEGKSGVTIHNLRDSAADREIEPATVHITFDPSTVRSRFAKFNPDDIKKNGLLLSDSSRPAQVMSAIGNEELKYLLGEKSKVNQIGNEKGNVKPNGVSVLKSDAPQGYEGNRLVYTDNGKIVGAMQIMKTPTSNHTVANTYVHPDYRRQSIATKLNEEGKRLFGKLDRSEEPSEAGQAFRNTLLSETSKPAQAVSAMANAPRFYSAVENAVNNIRQVRMPADQMLATLNNSRGVKPEEMDWLGLKEHLSNKGKEPVTKQEIQDFVNQNKVELKEVNKGELTEEEIRNRAKINKEDWDKMSQSQKEIIQSGFEKRPTKYSEYQLPGATNYREKLLTLPYKKNISDEQIAKSVKEEFGIDWNKLNEEGKQKIRNSFINNKDKITEYQSSHWDEPNVLAHVRMNDRNIEGKKSLHLEEIQSDWHQQGREKGYKPSHEEYSKKQSDLEFELNDIKRELSNPKLSKERQKELYQQESDIIDEWNKLHDQFAEGVVNAPFKKTWHELALKRMIREAAEKGYDRLSWTPGEAQSTNLRNLGQTGENVEKANEGMKGFYDQIIPKALEKISGQKVKTANLSDASIEKHPYGGYYATTNKKESPLFDTKEQVKEWMKKNNISSEPIHYIDIPQSLKDQALGKGFPLFSHTGHVLTPTSNPNINNQNDVPYGAGASNTPSGYPVHIDKRIPQYDEKLKLPSGESADLHSYLQVHEITEHQLMKRGMSYEQAHKRATENEKRAVKRDGLDWNTYEHIMDGYLKQTEHEKPENPPKNLYLKPYPHDKQVLLKKLEK